MKNRLLKIMLVIILFIGIICIIVLINNKLNDSDKIRQGNNQNANLPINYMHAFYAYPFTTVEETIGTADYTFVAKINSIKRTEYRNSVAIEVTADGSQTIMSYTPHTIYDVAYRDK